MTTLARRDKTNLSPSPTRFIGRAQELDRLTALFGDEGERLVTIYGPAGTGKTRLAEALAERMLGEYGAPGLGGVWVIDLSEATDVAEICAAVSDALRVPPYPSSDAETAATVTARVIAARGPVVLVLDNFEHLVAHAEATVGAWRQAAPEVRLLVTSREPLRLAGEVRFELAPLPLPDDDPGTDSDAMALLVDRIRARDPSFHLDDATTPLAATIVRRLEGIPLALELAASRIALLGLAGFIDRLQSTLDMLVADARDASRRHTTLRAALESSWSLLDATERDALAGCAVFRGGFPAEAALAVLAPGADDGDALGVLQSLRDKSLVRRDADGHGTRPARFRLFEAVRELADGKLDDQARAQTRARHAAFFLDAAQQWCAQTRGEGGAEAIAALAAERDNLLATHAYFAETGEVEALVRTALAIDTVAAIRGPLTPHASLLDRTITATVGHEIPTAQLARLHRARGRVRAATGRAEAALRDLDVALTLASDCADERLQAEVLVDLAIGHHQRREASTAQILYERALVHARACAATDIEGRILGNLGALDHDRRRLDEASAHYLEALALLREAGELRLEAIHVANLGLVEQERGNFDRARARFETALQLLTDLGDIRLEAIVLGNLGTLEHEVGDPQAARRVHERALAILRDVGDRRSEALCLGRLCRANAALGWIADATACAQAAERIVSRVPDPLVSEALAIDRAFVWVAAASEAGPEHEAALQRVHEVLRAARTPTVQRAAWIELSDDVRAGVRLLEASLRRQGRPPAVTRQGSALIVGPDATWLQAPEQSEPQDLSRRTALRLIVSALVEQHRANPGEVLSLDELLAAGWPGQKVVPTAAANRVYVALSALRKMGLRGHLLSRDGGYLIDPALPVDRVHASLPAS